MKYLRYAVIALVAITIIFFIFKLFDKNEAPELVGFDNKIKVVEKADVLKIKEGMTYEEIIKMLGKTNDLKTDEIEYHIVRYHVGEDEIALVFKKYTEKTLMDGKEMLERARPINPQPEKVSGTVSGINENGFDLLAKDKIIRVNITPATELISMSSILELKENDEVTVEFEMQLDNSNEGNAKSIRK